MTDFYPQVRRVRLAYIDRAAKSHALESQKLQFFSGAIPVLR